MTQMEAHASPRPAGTPAAAARVVSEKGLYVSQVPLSSSGALVGNELPPADIVHWNIPVASGCPACDCLFP